ncbi:type II toxin-antitoxin system mRNA interferase toxin, RelE/StbE family [Candidatus Curtissbacteria bacterium]|nr:type II toxin-antitoxin system mRNA interferase toxin, RelE/StbE family [Candidatus Curtissbacteria bacterium]
MRILFHKNYLKHYRKRILPNKKLDKRLENRLELFMKDPSNPLLEDHRLTGDKKEYRAFSITGDYRVVYKKFDDTVVLYDVGTHNQVY